ncbi:MAG: sigma-54 interaction domain-containing protein, partial [Desulfatiglandales bacterium]
MLEPSDSDLLKENLLAIIEGLDTGIIAHDLKRRIIYFNRAAEEITGYKRSEVLGKDCHAVFKEPFCGSRCHFLEGDPLELPKRPYDVTILTKGGRPRRVRMSVTPIGRGGRLTGVVASFSDITENLKTEGLGEKGIQFHGIVTRDPAMLQLIGKIREIAAFDYPVYIFGETGTGKELVANAIHQESRRAGGPFVTVNCAAIPETLLESEFFGYEKGAFTGAFRSRKGRFELAHEGTIFLDEIGELSKSTQAKLLRVVETMELTRLGAEAPTKVDVRILVATNRDLREEVRKGRFREDLFYRLSGLTLRLPPLRERPDDIPLLLEHFGSRMRQEGFG